MELQMAAIWPMAGCYCRVAIKRHGFVKFMPVLHSVIAYIDLVGGGYCRGVAKELLNTLCTTTDIKSSM